MSSSLLSLTGFTPKPACRASSYTTVLHCPTVFRRAMVSSHHRHSSLGQHIFARLEGERPSTLSQKTMKIRNEAFQDQYLHTPANTAAQITLVPGLCPSRSRPKPSLPLVWQGWTCFHRCLPEGIMPRVPVTTNLGECMGWNGCRTDGAGAQPPSTKEWEALETLGLQAIPQLRGRFVHWNIRPERALWQSRATSFFRLGEHSLQTCRRWDVSCKIFHGHQLDWVPQLPAWAAWSLSTGLQVMNSQRLI